MHLVKYIKTECKYFTSLLKVSCLMEFSRHAIILLPLWPINFPFWEINCIYSRLQTTFPVCLIWLECLGVRLQALKEPKYCSGCIYRSFILCCLCKREQNRITSKQPIRIKRHQSLLTCLSIQTGIIAFVCMSIKLVALSCTLKGTDVFEPFHFI